MVRYTILKMMWILYSYYRGEIEGTDIIKAKNDKKLVKYIINNTSKLYNIFFNELVSAAHCEAGLGINRYYSSGKLYSFLKKYYEEHNVSKINKTKISKVISTFLKSLSNEEVMKCFSLSMYVGSDDEKINEIADYYDDSETIIAFTKTKYIDADNENNSEDDNCSNDSSNSDDI